MGFLNRKKGGKGEAWRGKKRHGEHTTAQTGAFCTSVSSNTFLRSAETLVLISPKL